MKKEISLHDLRFTVSNDPEHDYDLMQEAWIGERMVAVIQRVGRQPAEDWHISFLPLPQEECLELPWKLCQEIIQNFEAFRAAMDQIPSTSEELSE